MAPSATRRMNFSCFMRWRIRSATESIFRLWRFVNSTSCGTRAMVPSSDLDGAFRHSTDELLVLHAVADQVGHREHFQIVALRELHQLRNPRHGAIVRSGWRLPPLDG